MNLQEWRAMQMSGDEATLPSGLTVRVKYISVLDLALSGQIPQTLAGKVEAVMKGGQIRNISLKEFREYADLVNLVCEACIVSPGRTELQVTELPYMDRLAIFNWSNQPASKLEPFRHQQNGAMEPVFSGDGLLEETV